MEKLLLSTQSHRDYAYRAYGLKIQSAIALPELVPDKSSDPIDVHIRCDNSIAHLPSTDSESEHFTATPDQVVLKAEGFTLTVAHGKEMTIHCDTPSRFEEWIRLRILGAGMGLLLQQRQCLVLHGATIVGKQGAAVVMGHSGDGKSTLTMQLVQLGYRLSGDDKCAIKIDNTGISSLPGSPYIKLSHPQLTELSIQSEKIHPLSALKHKVYVDLSSDFAFENVPLLGGIVLGKMPQVSVEKLTQRQTFDRIFEHSYRKKKFFQAGLQKSQFIQCHKLANTLPVYQYSRPLSGENIQPPAEAFLNLLQELIGRGR